MMKKENDPRKSDTSGNLPPVSRMEYRIELKLLLNGIMSDTQGYYAEEPGAKRVRLLLKEYLVDYHRQHGEFPVGCHNFGTTRNQKLEIGVIDLDKVRSKIESDLEDKRCTSTKAEKKTRDEMEAYLIKKIVEDSKGKDGVKRYYSFSHLYRPRGVD
jgi:hypothetical protein